MAVISQLNSAPYFDDFSPETKDFLRILFRPGYAVQVRELNQLQAILQTQIERFGNHIFNDGSIIIGGQTTIDCTGAFYVTLNSTYNGLALTVNSFLNQTIIGGTSGAAGLVTVVADINNTEPITLIYKPLNGAVFIAGEDIKLSGTPSATISSTTFVGVDLNTYPAVGPSSTVSISNGIFFTKGIFVICNTQTTYLDKYTNTPNKIAGLNSDIIITDSSMDISLLDNANGSYNYAAPGANRLQIALTLESKDLTFTSNIDTFINLLEVRNGLLYKQTLNASYSEIMKMLARRTFDESGDYTVVPFLLNLEAVSSDSPVVVSAGNFSVGCVYTILTIGTTDFTSIGAVSNTIGGTFTATGIGSGTGTATSLDYIKARMSAGKAYVKGYECQTIATEELDIPKSKTFESDYGIDVPISYGNYVTCSIKKGLPNINSFEQYYLYSATGATGPIGSARVRNIDFNGSTGPTYNLNLFDINILASGKDFSGVGYLGNSAASYSASTTIFALGATGLLSNPGTTPLVYDLGYNAARSLTSVQFTYKKYYNAVSVSGNAATIATGVNTERFYGVAGATGFFALDRDTNYIVTDNVTGNQIFNFNVALNSPDVNSVQTATISFPSQSNPVNIIATVNNKNAVPNTKTEQTLPYLQDYFAATTNNTNTVTFPSYASSTNDFYKNGLLMVTSGLGSGISVYTISGYNGTTKVATLSASVTVNTSSYFKVCPYFAAATSYTSSNLGIVYSASGNGNISLNVPDVTRIIKIITNITNPVMNDWFAASKEITNNYVLDNGQRDNYYDIASVSLKAGLSNSGPVVIFFEYLSHGNNDGFFCANSYPNRNVPYYYNDSTGKQIDLFNAIDCRPTKNTPTTFINSKLADAGTNFNFSASYYLQRIDKIVITTDGVFQDLEGIPSDNPKAPADLSNGLTLYSLFIPAYTYVPDSISIKFIENKRYTMRDIGKLDDRLTNVEYYVSLSALEQNTALFNVKDSDGLDRFKNGILVDSFTGHDVGDVYNPDYHCSIDIDAQEMQPEFRQKSYDLSLQPTGSSNYTNRGGMITKDFTDESFVSQPLASSFINVNPFSVFDWNGNLILTPSSDFWKDTSIIPTNVNNSDGKLDNVKYGSNPYGTLYNQWNSMWYGKEKVITGYEDVTVPARTINSWQTVATTSTTGSSVVTISGNGITGATGQSDLSSTQLTANNPSQALVQKIVTTTIPASTIEKPIYSLVNTPTPPPKKTTSIDSGNITVDVNMSEYIRAKTIQFSASGMKPSTTVYPFFDGKLVSKYVTPTGGSLGGALTTDASGNCSGSFAIPIGIFFVGDRIFLLTDSASGILSSSTTSSQATYVAQGLETSETTLNIHQTTTDSSSPFWTNTNQNNTKGRAVDPLAESFFVDSLLYPEGVFISKVDLYFFSKDSSIPLMVQIRNNVNGYPSESDVITSVTVPASSVHTSTDASVATTVVFNNVIYLAPGDYSIVLLSDSNNYNAWIAEIGKKQVNSNKLISQQPYVGSLFESQNASTWTADQTKDLTFVLYFCNFNTGNSVINFTDWDASNPDSSAIIATTYPTKGATGFNTLTEINASLNTITIPYHAFATGASTVYSKNGGSNSIGLTEAATYYVNRINSDTLSLYSSQSAALLGGATGLVPVNTSSGEVHTFTGGANILYLDQLFYNKISFGSIVSGATGIQSSTTVVDGSIFDNTVVLSAPITATIPAGTNITLYRKLEGSGLADTIMIPNSVFNPFSSASVSQYIKGYVNGVIDSTWTNVPTGKNYNYFTQHTIDAAVESFQKQIVMSVSSPFVSPVINITRQSVVQVENIINNNYLDENSSSGGNAWARYITRQVSLANDNSYLTVYLTANKPANTDILVYYKILSSSDSDVLANKDWVQMVQSSPTSSTFSTDLNTFLEYKYLPNDSNTSVSTGTRQMTYTSGLTTYNTFIQFALKVVLVSANTTIVPKCSDLRAIAVE